MNVDIMSKLYIPVFESCYWIKCINVFVNSSQNKIQCNKQMINLMTNVLKIIFCDKQYENCF